MMNFFNAAVPDVSGITHQSTKTGDSIWMNDRGNEEGKDEREEKEEEEECVAV